MIVDFELIGKTSLIMHIDSIEGSEAVKAWQNDSLNKNLCRNGDDRTPAWTWITYVNHDGMATAFGQENIMASLRRAAAQVILKKQKTFKESIVQGAIVTSEFCPFYFKPIVDRKVSNDWAQLTASELKPLLCENDFQEHVNFAKKKGFELFTRRAKIGNNKHIRVRPRFASWKITGTLNTTADELTKDVIKKIFEYAGKGGMGDWRPSAKTPGPYGQFEANLIFG